MKREHHQLELISRFSRGYRRFFVYSLLFSVLNTVFNALTPQVIRFTVDSVLGDKKMNLPEYFTNLLESWGGRTFLQSHLWIIVAAIIVIALLSGICNYESRVTIAKGSEGFVKSMRDTLYRHVQKLPMSWHVKHQTGDIIQRCTSDVEMIRNFVAGQMLEIFRVGFLIIFALIIMFSMNLKLSLVATAFIPIVVLYSWFFNSRITEKFLKADEAEGELSSVVQENLTGVRVVRAFGREKFEIDRFDEKNENFANLWSRLGTTLGAYWGVGDLFTGLQILVILVLGVIETCNGTITLGEFMAFISYNSTLVWPIRGLGRILSEMSKAGVSFDRVNYILNQQEEQDCEEPKRPSFREDIHFENINFQYDSSKPVLKNIDFTIKAGSTFAILGGTGSGKSTLMQLLNRLYELPPECGRITVGGVDLREMELDWVRKNVGMVLQEPFLFSRTIGENIAAFCPGVSFKEVRYAAEIACVDHAIRNFTAGYDTIVGERGVTLSGGQKQRVAIARMLMQKAPVMVFDDSLSAVDSETDFKIRTALKENLGDSTVILISHRITTLMQADMILVLEDGQIEEMGTHTELIARDGIYKKIYDIQMSQDDRSYTGQTDFGKGADSHGDSGKGI